MCPHFFYNLDAKKKKKSGKNIRRKKPKQLKANSLMNIGTKALNKSTLNAATTKEDSA